MGDGGLCNPRDNSYSIFILILLSVFYFFSFNRRPFKNFYIKQSSWFALAGVVFALTQIAKPNVKCYSPRSKASEAKIQLAAIYSAEVGAINDYGTYATCLEDLGYEQNDRGYYIVGFGFSDKVSSNVIKLKGSSCTEKNIIIPRKLLSSSEYLLVSTMKKMRQNVSKDQFTAYAVGNILNAKTESDLDIWSINEKKELVHVQEGIRKKYFHEEIRDAFFDLFGIK